MAFNWQTFKTRTLTAIIFGAIMLTGLLWNRWSFFILFSIIHFGCWWEYLKLEEKICNAKISKFSKFLLMDLGYIFFWLLAFKDHETPYHIIKIGFISITIQWLLVSILLIGLVIFLFSNKKISHRTKWMSIAGFIYISLSLGLMVSLYGIYKNDPMNFFIESFLPLAIMISLWINDTMAYIIGSLIGKTPLSKISPKKTWEGTIGGIVLTIIIGAVFGSFFQVTIILMFFSATASIAGTFGDLLESKLKRMAGVKDSGTFMPGHGGFLDRFDSMLLAIPAVWLYVYFFLK